MKLAVITLIRETVVGIIVTYYLNSGPAGRQSTTAVCSVYIPATKIRGNAFLGIYSFHRVTYCVNNRFTAYATKTYLWPSRMARGLYIIASAVPLTTVIVGGVSIQNQNSIGSTKIYFRVDGVKVVFTIPYILQRGINGGVIYLECLKRWER